MAGVGGFDPTSWFVGVAMSLLYGAIALAAAIAIIQYYLLWIIGIALVLGIGFLLIRLGLWWWRRPW
ncbi:MAG: hypothetical protein NTX33_00095 [Propionibacteriales bacterium]|nr:hypothetical protein [Propionibacteriales bacterium]